MSHEPLALVDVHYGDHACIAACIVAEHWTDESPMEERVIRVAAAPPYEPGRFYLRELDPILAALALVESAWHAVVVDGYVDLDSGGTPGLGAHLYAKLGRTVIGVAKTPYRGADHAARILRGTSTRPLFITARGIPLDRAATLVTSMHGPHRIPTLVAYVDRLARKST